MTTMVETESVPSMWKSNRTDRRLAPAHRGDALAHQGAGR